MSNSSISSEGNGNTSIVSPKRKQISPSKNWVFTWNNYPEDWIKFFSSDKIESYCIGKEVGEKEGTPHLQGYIKFSSKRRPKSVIESKDIHWEKCKDVKASIKYCMKDGDYILKNIIVDKPLSILKDSDMKLWQREIIDLIKVENTRNIYWYFDKKGGIGKSYFTKKLCFEYNALVLSGKSSDMKHGIVEWKKATGAFPTLIIIDLPRSFNKEYLSYTGIEEVKNGCFFSGKYEGRMCLFNNPNVIVFSNEEPIYEKMSKDRFIVKELKEA